MNEQDAQSSALWELASLPADDPRRKELDSRLMRLSPEERSHWLTVVRDVGSVQQQMKQAPISGGLIQRLLKIPEGSAPQPPKKRILKKPLVWIGLTGALAVIAVMATVAYFTPPVDTTPKALDALLAHRIAALAIEDLNNTRSLEIASNDPAKVQAALASRNPGFAPDVPQPVTQVQLLGGGVAQFDGKPAAFTRWTDGTNSYTLYQFDGKQAGLPSNFTPTFVVPKDLWQGPLHYQVSIRPDSAQSDWALVSEKEAEYDPVFGGCR